ncbi:hypothetical protein [Bacillus safensis]|uniref:hypothetical protein n=1 Tax=unclassified Bacillus (in: firmicutes) TaxID=185979 RepID=UPI001F5200F2|nr:hypothetical protein [Bacillus safensis]MDV3450061.1 hypothetical protein [Bacillus safensis]USD80773.1 hypothetical protein M5E03_08820 [Bacillus safensis]
MSHYANSLPCSSAASNEKQLTTANIIEAFKNAGLEAEEKPSALKQKEFGNIREDGKRILIPSLGENAGGRIFKFGNELIID